MRRRLALALLLTFALGAATTGVAGAQPATPGGCPQGFVAFDRQLGDGVPAAYEQGETVVASGVLIDTSAGVPFVTLRSGSPDGAELGRASVAADGSWQGLSFTVPEAVSDGAYLVYLVARDRNGTMLPGLPYPFQIRVGPPAATRQTPVASKVAAETPSSTSRGADADAMAKDIRSALEGARTSRPQVADRGRPAAPPVAAEPSRPAAQPVTAEPSRVASTEARPSSAIADRRPVRAGGRVSAASSPRPRAEARATPLTGLRPATPPEAAPRAAATAPQSVATPLAQGVARGQRDGLPWASMSVLLAALIAGGYVMARRRPRPPEAEPTAVEPVVIPPGCPVEAELQAIVTEESEARDQEREPALA